MIRFMPDNLSDWLLRPLDIVSPDSGIYLEYPAPDLRLAAAVLLALVAGGMALRLRAPMARPTRALLIASVLAYLAWMATSGNGRYFMPVLVLMGPLCVGLVHGLRTTVAFKLTLALMLVLLQAYLAWLRPPWRVMSWMPWQDRPFFQVADIPPATDMTYVMLELAPYSLVAPLFPEAVHWVRLPAVAGPRERAFAQRVLAQPRERVLVVPAALEEQGPAHQPTAAMARRLDALLQGAGLALRQPAQCRFLPSRDMATALTRGSPDPVIAGNGGLWMCPLDFQAGRAASGPAPGAPAVPPEVEAVFDAAERLCPRFFRHGEAPTQPTPTGFIRYYPGSDTRLLVGNEGTVAYRYWLRLNPVIIGSSAQVLRGEVKVDCDRIRASNWRTGGP